MINWLLEQSLVCSIIIALFLLGNKWLNSKIGANNTYSLWLIIPITLLLPLLDHYLKSSSSIAIFEYTNTLAITQVRELSKSNLSGYLVWLWLFGAISLIIYHTLYHLKTLNNLELKPTTQPETIVNAEHLRFFESSHLKAPVVTGITSPAILMPSNFNSLYKPSQQRLILNHELSHIQNKDLYWNLIALFTLAVFWFNPLFWLAYRNFRQQQELACDQRVLQNKSTKQRQEYAYAMLIAASANQSKALTHLNYNEDIYMKERIKLLNNHKVSRGYKALPSLLILLITAVTGHSVFAHDEAAKPKPIYREAPKYPQQAETESLEGHVVIKFDIEKDGTVSNPKAIESVPAGIFDHAALNAIKNWQYSSSSAGSDGVRVRLDFALSNKQAAKEKTKYTGTEIVEVMSK